MLPISSPPPPPLPPPLSRAQPLHTLIPSTYLPGCLIMTGKPVAKRPIVFTWAHIQKYPTLEARYAETLPFKTHPVSCKCLGYKCILNTPESFKREAECIKRTGERLAVGSSSSPLCLPFQQLSPIEDIKAERLRVPRALLTKSNDIVVLCGARYRRPTRRTAWYSRLSSLGDPSKDSSSSAS